MFPLRAGPKKTERRCDRTLTWDHASSAAQSSRLRPARVQIVLVVRTDTAVSSSGSGWGLWRAPRAAAPAGGTAAWSGGCCCPSRGGRTCSSASGSTAGCRRSRTAGVRWRSCRSRGCSSCWGWPAGRRASRWRSRSLQGKHRFMSHALKRQQLIWGVYFLSRGSRAAARTHWAACEVFILASSTSLSLCSPSRTQFKTSTSSFSITD